MFLAGVAILLCLGHDPKNLPQWRVNILTNLAHFASFLVNLQAGFCCQRRKRVDVDYSRYLGPNYEKTYDKSGVNIINHTSFYEPSLSLFLMGP